MLKLKLQLTTFLFCFSLFDPVFLVHRIHFIYILVQGMYACAHMCSICIHKYIEQSLYTYIIHSYKPQTRTFLVPLAYLNHPLSPQTLNDPGRSEFNWTFLKSDVSILDVKFAVLIHPILLLQPKNVIETRLTGHKVRQDIAFTYFSQISENHWPKKDFPVYFDKK